MIPDLGKYADTVLSAYAISILLLVALVVLSLRRGRKVRARDGADRSTPDQSALRPQFRGRRLHVEIAGPSA
ncbi:heme exporter protein CcmD [Jhaorihella thermophila]